MLKRGLFKKGSTVLEIKWFQIYVLESVDVKSQLAEDILQFFIGFLFGNINGFFVNVTKKYDKQMSKLSVLVLMLIFESWPT